eukprot:jgi/Undpi1/9238/HiC_scaffold_26.g11696.m1
MFTTNGILTPNNISTYKATGEAYLGELFNISQDGTAIDLGNEPSVPFDTKDLDTDWSTNIRLKTSSVTQQCIFSIDDGAGGRLIDVMHVWFSRPVHMDDFYFDDIIDTYCVSSRYQSLTLTHDSAAVCYSQTQADTRIVNSSSVWAVGFSDSTVETTYYEASSGPDTKYHSFCRTDHEGLNEITVDCLNLLGTNDQVENYACNVDDNLLYFGHPSTHVLHSVDFDLTNSTEYTLDLNSGVDSDIQYSDGWLNWANKNPLESSDNTSLWRMNVNTDEY